jgi:hypothetical protein
MRAALEYLVGATPGQPLTGRQVSNRLKTFKRHVAGGFYLDFNPNEYHRGGMVWRLHQVESEI